MCQFLVIRERLDAKIVSQWAILFSEHFLPLLVATDVLERCSTTAYGKSTVRTMFYAVGQCYSSTAPRYMNE